MSERNRKVTLGVPLTIILFLVLYVLSIGPAMWLSLRTRNDSVVNLYLQYCTEPIHQLARIRVPGELITSYINLWLPKPGSMTHTFETEQNADHGIVWIVTN